MELKRKRQLLFSCRFFIDVAELKKADRSAFSVLTGVKNQHLNIANVTATRKCSNPTLVVESLLKNPKRFCTDRCWNIFIVSFFIRHKPRYISALSVFMLLRCALFAFGIYLLAEMGKIGG